MVPILTQQLVVWTKSEEATVRRLKATLACAGGLRRQPDQAWQDDDRALLQATSRLRLLRSWQSHLAPMNA